MLRWLRIYILLLKQPIWENTGPRLEGASGGHQQSSIGGEAPNIPSHVPEKPPKNPRLQCSHLTCFKPGMFKPRPEKDFYRGHLEVLGLYSTGELPHGSREGSMLPIGFIRIPETLWSL